MARTAALSSAEWSGLAADQAGVVALRQLIALGITADQARQWVRSGRWQRILPGVYATFTGPVSFLAQIWAAVLHAGPAAAASHRTALWLERVIDRQPSLIEVVVPAHRRVQAPRGIVVRGCHRFDQSVRAAAQPPRVRLEDAVLDVAATITSTDAVLSLVFRVTQHRLTTAKRLRAALARRKRYRHRGHSVICGTSNEHMACRSECAIRGKPARAKGTASTGTCDTAHGGWSSNWMDVAHILTSTVSVTCAETTSSS